ncbi:VOC family protein [Thermomonas aquatica]|uniref:VOC family protein n=1 Tax=Thermomonas aquatica TaxID=2202149 RepID=UPI001F111DD3|nr:VOC family protein [Thermomonas aquatica]
MSRFHVHLNVVDLAASVRFYSELFAAQPTVFKQDYAKWMLEDPRVNFAISSTGRPPGIDHLGLQVDSSDELATLGKRLDAAGGTVVPEQATICCYATSDKNWTEDPQARAGKRSTPWARRRRITPGMRRARPMARPARRMSPR